MDGGIFKPYRVPCGISFGNNCYSHAKASDFGLDRYTNVTSVGAAGGCAEVGTIYPPCERYAPDSGGTCETFNCDGSLTTCEPWLGANLTTDYVQYTLVAGQPNTVPQSWSHASGDTVNFAVCQKQGFKNVAAQRRWHGRYGFINGQDLCANTGCLSGGSYIAWRAYDGSPDQTKYLVDSYSIGMTTSWTVDTTYNDSAGNPHTLTNTWGYNYTYSGVITVDPNSGLRTLSGYSVTETQTWHISGDTFATSVVGTPAPSDIVSVSLDYNPLASGFVQTYYHETDVNNRAATTGYLTYIEGFNACGEQIVYTGANAQALSDFNAYVASNPGFVDAAYLEAFFAATFLSVPGTSPASFTNTISNSVSLTDTAQIIDFSATSTSPSGAPTNQSFTFTLENSHTLSGTNPASSVYADWCTLLGKWDLTDDHVYPWRTSGLLSAAPLVTRNEVGSNVIPGPVFTLLPDYRSPLTDVNGVAAFASGWIPTWTMFWYDEACFVFQFPAGESSGTAAATALIQMVDGAILGAPLAAGYQNFFCWQFTDWRGCADEGSGKFLFWTYGWGMFLEDYNSAIGGDLPLTATQWTNNYQAIGTPPGAYLAYNDPTIIDQNGYEGTADAGGLFGYKYAEILERWPSQNFSRPSGADKFLYDETLVYCVSGLSGSGSGATFTLTDSGGSGVTLASTSGVWGGSSVGGFYHITQSGSTVTLGTKMYDLPTGWVSLSGDDDVCFGKLRFDGCASLRGRQAITVASMTATFAVGQPQFGMASATHTEQVDLYDATYTLVASNVTATRASDSTFTTATAYPTAVWVTITGVSYYFDDDLPKGDFVVLQWGFDYRTNGEIARLTGQLDCSGSQVTIPTANFGYAAFEQDALCLASQPCNPAVVCFTPNGETFANGITYAFPTSFVLDDLYGSRWQGYVQQTMTDLFWQQPHIPCGLTVAWTMDNGTCEADTDVASYYPIAPAVEARITLPNTYGVAQNETPAALPSGISIGWLSPVDHNTGDVAYPPGFIGFNTDGTPKSIMTPWVLHSLLCAAITPASTCRFKGDYESQVIDCA